MRLQSRCFTDRTGGKRGGKWGGGRGRVGELKRDKKEKEKSASQSISGFTVEIIFCLMCSGEEKKKSVDCVCSKCLCSVFFVQGVF